MQRTQIDIYSLQTNGHECSVAGVAELKGDKLVLVENDKSSRDFGNGFSVELIDKTLTIKYLEDPGLGFPPFCGARARLDRLKFRTEGEEGDRPADRASAQPDIQKAADEQSCIATCNAEPNGTIPCISQCIGEQNQKLDIELNATYKALREHLRNTLWDKKLVAAERAWIRDRDKLCIDLADSDYLTPEEQNNAHASIGAMNQDCIQRETEHRIEFLKAALEQLQNDGIVKFHL
jgi:uncharacterized protein YecT (DUF1311 family)